MKTYISKVRAFTLIELLIVIAIIALLTGIILTSLTGSKAKARDAKRISDLGHIQLALELYYDRCKQYPDPISSYTLNIDASNGCPSGSGISLRSYISSIPTDPSTGAYVYLLTDSDLPEYRQDYVLQTALEYPNSVQQDSLKSADIPPYFTFDKSKCYNGSNNYYCIGPK